MAAPGLTKLFDKLNIVEIQFRNVVCKAICCGVFGRHDNTDKVDDLEMEDRDEDRETALRTGKTSTGIPAETVSLEKSPGHPLFQLPPTAPAYLVRSHSF